MIGLDEVFASSGTSNVNAHRSRFTSTESILRTALDKTFSHTVRKSMMNHILIKKAMISVMCKI